VLETVTSDRDATVNQHTLSPWKSLVNTKSCNWAWTWQEQISRSYSCTHSSYSLTLISNILTKHKPVPHSCMFKCTGQKSAVKCPRC